MKTFLKWIITLRKAGHFDPHSGQAIVLIGAAAIGLIAMMGLAIDGGRLLFLRRDTQNAADAAAIAAARALCTNRNPEPYALAAADANGFDNNRTDNWVDVYAPPQSASFAISDDCLGCYVEVEVKGEIPPTFIGLVYGGELSATSRAIGTCNPDITFFEPPDLRAVVAMGNSCPPNDVVITGSNIFISGGAHSNGDMMINPDNTGGGIVIGATTVVEAKDPTDNDPVISGGEEKITWQTDNTVQDTGETPTGSCLGSCFTDLSGNGAPSEPGPYVTDPMTDWPIEHDIADFQPSGGEALLASSQNKYYEWNCSGPANKFSDWVEENHIDGTTMDNGIYYADCDITLNGLPDGLTGNVTIVSTGNIDVSGDGQNWQPYTQDLLLFSTAGTGCEGGIKFSGSNNSWEGNIFAPNGEIQLSGAQNNEFEMHGCLVANQVELSGSNTSIICEPDYDNDVTPGIWISE